MDKLEALGLNEIKPIYRFAELPVSGAEYLRVKGLSIGYSYPLLPNINFSIKSGEKVVITGFNGIGKSTLLKTLMQQIPSLQGEFLYSNKVALGYFEQDLTWEEDALTPLQIVTDAYPSLSTKVIRQQLFRCGISSKHAIQEIATLSGGEQAKVKMCLLALKPCNFLILDEPTNHLDIQAKEALQAGLSSFQGTILMASHEEAFYREWAQRIINIEAL